MNQCELERPFQSKSKLNNINAKFRTVAVQTTRKQCIESLNTSLPTEKCIFKIVGYYVRRFLVNDI